MENNQQLHKALEVFIEAMRQYIPALLINKYGSKLWEEHLINGVRYHQQENLIRAKDSGTQLHNLIDYSHLKQLAITYKELLYNDFGKKAYDLPTYFSDIAEVRNKCNHYQEIEKLDFNHAFNRMIKISKILKMTDLEKQLQELHESSEKPAKKNASKDKQGMIAWFHQVEPHEDIKKGNLDESVFAANLGEVASENGRAVYQYPRNFFQKTYFTEGLKNIAKRVISGLNKKEDGENRVISLQTGFGGGKTHSLIMLYHLANQGKKLAGQKDTEELLTYAGQPEFNQANIAVFTNTTNDPVSGRKKGDLTLRTLWGDLAHQLGGLEGYEIIRENDEKRVAPKGLFKEVLKKAAPALILIDELADYCVPASGVSVGASTLSDQTISFIQELTEAVSATPGVVLVATLTASDSEVANSPKAAQILSSLSGRLSRVGADTQPVADEEIFEVIRRRLFENIGNQKQIDVVVKAYETYYQKNFSELPPRVKIVEYKRLMKKSYPFHPELIDIFRKKWASHHGFQRTRGVLRLLAAITSDLWKRQNNLSGPQHMIHPSDIRLENLDPLIGQIKRLYGNGYEAVISADISGRDANAQRLDLESTSEESLKFQPAQGVAITLLLNSFGQNDAKQGLSIKEIKFAVLRPDGSNHNTIHRVLDQLEEQAHYLHYTTLGGEKRYWFHTKPNVNILINQARGDVSEDDINKDTLSRLKKQISGISTFKILLAPELNLPEFKQNTLIILHPAKTIDLNSTEKWIENLASKRGDQDRQYKNTMLFLAPTPEGKSQINQHMKTYLACKRVKEEYQTQIDSDQVKTISKKADESSKNVDQSILSAYSVVCRHQSKKGLTQIKFTSFNRDFANQVSSGLISLLKDEEWLLPTIGRGILIKNNLWPKEDVAINVQKIYESFLKYDDKPMIMGADAIIRSIQNFCHKRAIEVAVGKEGAYDRVYQQEDIIGLNVDEDDYWIIAPGSYQKEEPVLIEESKIVSADTDAGKPKPLVSNPTQTGNMDSGNSDDIVEPSESSPVIPHYYGVDLDGEVDLNQFLDLFKLLKGLSEYETSSKIEIAVRGSFKENDPIFQIVKEAASQLGLNFTPKQ